MRQHPGCAQVSVSMVKPAWTKLPEPFLVVIVPDMIASAILSRPDWSTDRIRSHQVVQAIKSIRPSDICPYMPYIRYIIINHRLTRKALTRLRDCWNRRLTAADRQDAM